MVKLQSFHIQEKRVTWSYSSKVRDSVLVENTMRLIVWNQTLRWLVSLVIACLFWAIPHAVHASSSATGTSSSGSSTMVLDRYGNAVQLQHALNAAKEQGSLVMVIDRSSVVQKRRNSRSLWVVSLADDTPTHLRPQVNHPSTENSQQWVGKPYTGPNAFLKPLLSSFSHSFTTNKGSQSSSSLSPNHPQLAVVMVGVHGDALWMQSQLNRYSMILWERTNQGVSVEALLGTITTLLRQSAGLHPTVPNSHGSALELLLQEQQQQQKQQQLVKFGRPLGICALVLNLNAAPSSGGILARIIPSGQVEYLHHQERPSLICLGKHGSAMEAWWNQERQLKTESEEPSTSKLDKTTNDDYEDDLALCRHLKEGLTLVLGKAPKALCIEMWNGKTVIRRQVDLDSSSLDARQPRKQASRR